MLKVLIGGMLFLFQSSAFAQSDTTKLLCVFNPPAVSSEADESWLIELDFKKMQFLITTYSKGALLRGPGARQITSVSDQLIESSGPDTQGRLSNTITINRLTGEYQQRFYIYGAERDKLWNHQLNRIGGFAEDPVVLGGTKAICKRAEQKF